MKSQRQSDILKLLLLERSLKTEELAERFHVSIETIRRDINSMAAEKVVRKVYGGIELVTDSRRITEMADWDARLAQCHEEKVKLATRALECIPDGATVALDIGTTAYELASLLGTKRNLTIITNSLRVATQMAQSTDHNVYCIGGLMTRVEIVAGGMAARDFLNNFAAIDFYMCSTDGVTLEHGMTEFDEAVVDVKRRLVEISDHVIAMIDHSKFGKRALFPTCALSQLDLLITDSGTSPYYLERLDKAGVPVEVTD